MSMGRALTLLPWATAGGSGFVTYPALPIRMLLWAKRVGLAVP
jgi:hypothetical protein